ncbi:MAG: hypothetical protein ABEJ31_13925 [Haloarculaceae archaeon]
MSQETHTDADRTATDAQPDPEGEVWSRRSFVRYLAPISVAVPVAVEGRTLVGLLRQDFGGGTSSYDKPTGVAVGIGGELRPDTPTTERLADATLEPTGDGSRLALTVDVKNTADAPYKLSLGAVTTDADETVDGGATTSSLEPGGSTTLRATYDLPADAAPKAVDTTVTIGNDASKQTVQLAPLPDTGD